MIVNTTCKVIFSWNKNGHKALIALATDDMLFATTHTSLFHILIAEFDKYFSTTVLQGSQLTFLNYRIIQSKYGTSIDQTNHIEQKILMEYFGNVEPSSVPFQSSPFPTNTTFEMELFQALPLSEQELITYTKILVHFKSN